MTYAQHAYKPIKRLGAVSFSIASILHIHLSIHILQYECVRLIYIRHTSSLKLFVDARVEIPRKTSQDKNITKTANIKRHGFTVQKWLTHAHSLFSAQIGGFEFDIPHWLWDGWHDPRNYTWLHFQGLVCIDLTIPQRECFVSEEGGWVKQNSPVLPVLP